MNKRQWCMVGCIGTLVSILIVDVYSLLSGVTMNMSFVVAILAINAATLSTAYRWYQLARIS